MDLLVLAAIYTFDAFVIVLGTLGLFGLAEKALKAFYDWMGSR